MNSTNLFQDKISELEKENTRLKEKIEKTDVENVSNKLRYYSYAVEHSPASIVIANVNGDIEYVNPKFVNLTGYQPEEVIGKNPRILNSGEKTQLEYKEMWNTLSSGKEWRGEFHNKKKNGEFYWESASISPVLDDEGNTLRFVAVKEDITERKNMEFQLQKLYRAVEQSPVSIVITDTDGNIEYVNPKFEKLTGYKLEEVVGKNPRILNSGEKAREEYQEMWNTISSGKEWHGEFHNRKKNGELYWEFASLSPIENEKGMVMYFIAVKEDITERKLMEESIKKAYQTIKSQQDKMLEELEQARETQYSLLPEKLPDIPKAKIYYKYKPMEQIGGDFYNVFQTDDNLFGIMVADVTGHGVSAALISFMVSGFFSENCNKSDSTKSTLQLTNKSLEGKLQNGKFASIIYGIYNAEKQTLTYTTAGHPTGIVVRPTSKKVFYLGTKGMFVGLFSNEIANYEEKVFQLEPEDRVFFYTDAIIEAVNEKDELLGIKRFSSFLVENCHRPMKDLLDDIYELGLNYSGKKSYDDDFTLIGLEVKPA